MLDAGPDRKALTAFFVVVITLATVGLLVADGPPQLARYKRTAPDPALVPTTIWCFTRTPRRADRARPMTAFDGCQRGHSSHATRRVEIELGGRTPYHDYPSIPTRLGRRFVMDVYEAEAYIDWEDARYCPGQDAVSETIVGLGLWEPRETILTLTVCSSPAEGCVIDFGAHIGWFTLLAASCGRAVGSFECDRENYRLLHSNLVLNGWADQVIEINETIDATSPELEPGPIRLAKLDVEGAEYDAIRMLWPSIEGGTLDHLMVEIEPGLRRLLPRPRGRPRRRRLRDVPAAPEAPAAVSTERPRAQPAPVAPRRDGA